MACYNEANILKKPVGGKGQFENYEI